MSTGTQGKVTAGDISNDDNVNGTSAQNSSTGLCSVRHGLALLLHLCNFIIFTQFMSLSIAMPAMVNNTVPPSPPNTSTEGSLDNWNETLPGFRAVAPRYDWSPEIQGLLLSTFHLGAFLASIPSGYLAGKFTAKCLVGAALFVSSVLNLFIPLAAKAGVVLLSVLRIVQGVAEVMILTSQYLIWVKWAPPLEMNQLITIAISGLWLGSLTALLAGGFLCETLGWPSAFYVFGGIGCACSGLWFSLVYDDPTEHPFISAGERDYIVRSLAQQDCPPGQSLPVKAMIRSLPLWSILVTQFTAHWYFHVLMAFLPMYISSVLQVGLQDSGYLSALLLGVGFVFIVLGGLLADFLLSRKILTLLAIRKLFTAVGVLVPSLFSVLLSWVSSSFGTAVAFLGLCMATSSFCQSGALVNFMDIAPRYTCFLKGLSVVFANLSGVIAPTVSGFFIGQDPETGWRNIFLLSAAVNICGLVFYLVFSQAEVQDWAREQTFTHL
ncbi:probable small intestine urate exporter [Saccopteryx leptura]|uniref:probable small intestine urate exporter n=1 Tax=Saccopteryx leptura TaxID=249018 RepID=UPI00339CD598